jgi:hypothetical protein
MYFCGVILEPEYMRSFRRITKDQETTIHADQTKQRRKAK